MTWGGVLHASVIAWGGVAKQPAVRKGVQVPPHS